MNPRRNLWFSITAAMVPPLLTGCTRAPYFDILGSFFPAWLLCFIPAVALTFVVHLVLRQYRVEIAFPVLAYASLTAFFTFALWLIFFH